MKENGDLSFLYTNDKMKDLIFMLLQRFKRIDAIVLIPLQNNFDNFLPLNLSINNPKIYPNIERTTNAII